MSRNYKIAVLPGDRIGPEAIKEAVKVLKDCEEVIPGLRLDFRTYKAGAGYWKRNGKKAEWEPGSFEACQEADAILMGAIGLPGADYSDGRQVGTDVCLGFGWAWTSMLTSDLSSSWRVFRVR